MTKTLSAPPPYQEKAPLPGEVKLNDVPVIVTQSGAIVTQPKMSATITQPFRPPRDYLCLSCISALFCLPMGALAIVFSYESKTAAEGADLKKASAMGRRARCWATSAIVITLLVLATFVVMFLSKLGAGAWGGICSVLPGYWGNGTDFLGNGTDLWGNNNNTMMIVN